MSSSRNCRNLPSWLRQTTFLVADELLGNLAAMRREPIPNQQDVAGDVAEQVFEKLNDLFGLDGPVEDLKVEVPQGDTSNHREGLPVEMELQDWRLSARCPSSPPVRSLAQTTFVDEDDRPALFLGFFLISGQRRCCQSSMRASFRSQARPTGCCTLHRNCRRMRQTCPG